MVASITVITLCEPVFAVVLHAREFGGELVELVVRVNGTDDESGIGSCFPIGPKRFFEIKLSAIIRRINVVKMNFHTADFKEIERWVAKLYESRTKKQISEQTKRVMADQIVAMRKHSVHGLSKEEVDSLNDPKSEFWDSMFQPLNDDQPPQYLIDVIAQAPECKPRA